MLNILLLIVWAISAISLIVLVLMPSGKGTGISDMFASSLYNVNSGTAAIEKNLDRLTLICAIVFAVTLIIFMLTYPQGTIG